MTTQVQLTLLDLSRCCAVEVDFLIEMMQEGIVSPVAGHDVDAWRFDEAAPRTVKVAWRLHRDLGVNWPGAALALQLLEELETLRARLPA